MNIKITAMVLGLCLFSPLLSTASENPYLLNKPHELFDAPEETREEILVREFASYATYYASRKGYRFGHGAQSLFEGRFAFDAAKFVLAAPPGDYESAKKYIRKNYRMLIDAMIQASEEIPNYKKRNPRIIGEQTLSKAMRKICPLWPFCK